MTERERERVDIQCRQITLRKRETEDGVILLVHSAVSRQFARERDEERVWPI